jgi:hypothetical protein
MSNRMTVAMVALLAAGPALAGGFDTPVVNPAPAQPVVGPVSPIIAATDWSVAMQVLSWASVVRRRTS